MLENRILRTELVNWRKIKPLQPENFKHIFNYAAIEKSLIKHGFSQPFYVWEHKDEMYAIDGHTRIEVLSNMESAPELLPATFIDAKNKKEAIKILLDVYNQKQNPIDNEILTEYLMTEEIETTEVEVESLNVMQESIDKAKQIDAVEDNYDGGVPEIPETVLGDLYEIGEHRLLCGDSTCSDTVAKLMNGKKADMVFTDPPYDLENLSFTDNIFLFSYGHQFICNSEQRNVDISSKHRDLMTRWYAIDFRQAHLIANNRPMNRVDYVVEFRNSEKTTFNNLNDGFTTLIECCKIHSNKGETIHTQEKKVELPAKFIEHFSNENANILDIFLGSGSTMVAAHQLKRKCYGLELDCRYADVIVKRMLKLDKTLKIKLNGIDVTEKWLSKL